MRRQLALVAEVLRRRHEPAAEEHRPEPVDGHARGQRVPGSISQRASPRRFAGGAPGSGQDARGVPGSTRVGRRIVGAAREHERRPGLGSSCIAITSSRTVRIAFSWPAQRRQCACADAPTPARRAVDVLLAQRAARPPASRLRDRASRHDRRAAPAAATSSGVSSRSKTAQLVDRTSSSVSSCRRPIRSSVRPRSSSSRLRRAGCSAQVIDDDAGRRGGAVERTSRSPAARLEPS